MKFTDSEHRILLSALTRERKVCEELDQESSNQSSMPLVPLVDSIEKKISKMQYQNEKCLWVKGITSVETCQSDIDMKLFNRFRRQGAKYCPFCQREIEIS